MKSIAVFFGGVSVEHDVSVITGVLTCNSLDKSYSCVPIYVDRTGEWFTGESLLDPDNFTRLDYKKLTRVSLISGSNVLYAVRGKKFKQLCVISAAINCMHGERGEDGSLAGVLKMSGIANASSDVYPSALAMDKTLTKRALKGIVKTLPYVFTESVKQIEEMALPFDYPVIVKPVFGGSSIGVKIAENKDELSRAVGYALRFGKRVIVEPCLKDFTEINCAAYKNVSGIKVSECEMPVRRTDYLTFADKYESGKRVFPADIPQKISDKIKKITEKVYDIFGFNGVIRIDYFLKDDTVYLNEINSVPGSLAYYLFSDTLAGFTEMLDELLEVARINFAEDNTVKKTYDSGILSSVGSKSAKHL
ncbi:MAG: ATP-grasp domain-containing protein [Clostridia bacterium]|nr:ATP-grasp domain-containing protein [Clostridia bacterium]